LDDEDDEENEDDNDNGDKENEKDNDSGTDNPLTTHEQSSSTTTWSQLYLVKKQQICLSIHPSSSDNVHYQVSWQG
jgi:hypothetical protein